MVVILSSSLQLKVSHAWYQGIKAYMLWHLRTKELTESGLMQVELLFISGMMRMRDQAQEAKIGREGGRAVGYTMKAQFLVI